VREVVTRTLRQLRKEGLLETSRDEIILLDPIALSEEAGERERVFKASPPVASATPTQTA
jgi:hypothetical protein